MNLELLRKKVKEAFEVMFESKTDESIKSYEKAVEELKKSEKIAEYAANERARKEEADKERAEAMKEKISQPTMEDNKLKEEAIKFVEKIREALTVGTNFTGVIPTEIAQRIERRKEELGGLRKYCTIHNTSGNYNFLVDGGTVEATYVNEGVKIDSTDISLNQVELSSFDMYVLFKVSEKFISDVAVDLVAFLTEKIAKAFVKKENEGILKGTGDKQMTGVITKYKSENDVIATTSAAGKITLEDIKELMTKMKFTKENARLVMNESTMWALSSLKDGSNYIFSQKEGVKFIFGVPVEINPAMDNIETGKIAIVLGDFSYYHIANRMNMELKTLKELYAESDMIGFRAKKSIDGKPSTKDAFALLKVK